MIHLDHFLEELQFTIRTQDRIKALAVLSYLGELGEEDKRRLFAALDPGEEDFGIWLLGHLVANGESALREQLLAILCAKPLSCLRQIEREEDPATRALFIELAGELQLDVAPFLQRLLEQETVVPVIQAILGTLGSLGKTEAIPAISDYLYATQHPLVLAAIGALENIGTVSAVERLGERMGTSDDIDLLILDALARIQSDAAIETLCETLKSHHASTRNRAKNHLAALGPKAVPVLVERLTEANPDLLIHTLNLLGTIRDLSAAASIRKLLQSEPPDANVRFAAYEALGLLPLSKGAYILAEGLADPVEQVRIAAARAIERNYHPVLAVGLKNLVQAKGAEQVVSALLEAEADQLVALLMEDPTFKALATTYLEGTHPDTRSHFAALLEGKAATSGGRPSIMAVDDSRMILSILKNTLYQLGYEPKLFEFPTRLLEALHEATPALLITDLNMPELTGIELTRLVRQRFAKGSLPILMVTTQGDLEDRDEAFEAGVDAILMKPFTKEALHQQIDRLLKAPA